MREESAQSLREFYEVVERLRAPGGCPWDREQTHATLAPYLLEETYEVLEAIDTGHYETLREELADVLLQIFMHCAIAAESGGEGFDIGDVADVGRAKMVHRHPHVFGDASVRDAADVVINWEKLKAVEKPDRESILDGVPRTLPALAYAQAIQKRPARLGFDDVSDVECGTELVLEQLQAVKRLLADAGPTVQGQDWVIREGEIARGDAAGEDQAAQPTEPLTKAIGSLLFASAALARVARVNAEDALRHATNEFADRFRAQEAAARQEGRDLHAMSPEDWQATNRRS